MTWNDYAAENKQCFVSLDNVTIQATRHEPAKQIKQWVVFLPAPCVIGTVNCSTIDEARKVAARYGCTIIL